jgi:hypothetical protein
MPEAERTDVWIQHVQQIARRNHRAAEAADGDLRLGSKAGRNQQGQARENCRTVTEHG